MSTAHINVVYLSTISIAILGYISGLYSNYTRSPISTYIYQVLENINVVTRIVKQETTLAYTQSIDVFTII